MANESQSKIRPTPTIVKRIVNGATINTVKTVITPVGWIQDLSEWLYPPANGPDIVKTYEARNGLPVRIFFPKGYDQTSPHTLPTIFSIHGGGFCIGQPKDDDTWNRRFADMHNVLVIALNYWKAPWQTFPNQGKDVEALMLSVHADESLPIDKSKIAFCGFSAGGNLALSVSQLPTIRNKIKPSAVMPIYPALDLSLLPEEKVKRRHYKPELGRGLRASRTDILIKMAWLFDWSYIPYGQNLQDPLLSPIFATRAVLPRHLYIVACELDQLGHEAWRMACKMSGRPEPVPDDKVGRAKPAKQNGHLVLDDQRFSFQHVGADGKTVQWLLVPDQIHGFDHLSERLQGVQGYKDGQLKEIEYSQILGDWLRDVVWKDSLATS